MELELVRLILHTYKLGTYWSPLTFLMIYASVA